MRCETFWAGVLRDWWGRGRDVAQALQLTLLATEVHVYSELCKLEYIYLRPVPQ